MGITLYGSVFFYTVQIQASRGLNVLGVTDPAQAGFLTSVASVGVPLGTFIYSRIGRWPVQRLLVLEFALLAIGFLTMGGASAPNGFLIGCFFNQLGAGMLLPTLLVWAMSLLPFDIRARGAGLWQASFALGQFLSPVVVTFITRQVGGLLGAFTVLSAGAVIGLVLVLLVAGRVSRPDTAASIKGMLHG
jgi:predicted MFS family arabinose efflux permease